MTQLGGKLREIAEGQPPPVIGVELFDRARRRDRIRARVAAPIIAMAVTAAVIGAAGMLGSPHETELAAAAFGRLAGDGAGGILGWVLLAVVLAMLCVLWRRLRFARLARRLTAVAAVGALIVLAGPPGTALWAEPHGRAGLPDRLAENASWTWAADLRQSPLGHAALAFSGRATHSDYEEGRLALLAADGDRYRVFDVFQDPLFLPSSLGGSDSVLSPDGRYLSTGYGTFDLTTGKPAPGVLQHSPLAWSGDGRRIVRGYGPGVTDLASLQLWDLPSGRALRSISGDVSASSSLLALSPTGDRLAVQFQDRILVYQADGGPPISWPRDEWHLSGNRAWSPDGKLLALTGNCKECGSSFAMRSGILVVDALTGSPVQGGSFRQTPADYTRVQGWRSPSELVVQNDAAVHVFTLGNPAPATLFTLPAGVSRIEIAADRLADPIRPAEPATYGPPNLFTWLVGAVVAVPLAALAALWFLARGLREVWLRRRRKP